jgi:hypothetical protein
MRRWTAGVAITIVVAVAVAAGAGATACATAGVRDAKGPGASLPSGFVVAPNSRLVGVPFELPHEVITVLEIDRDPVGVYDAYATQARALGFPLPGSAAIVEPARHGSGAQAACHYGLATMRTASLDDPRAPTARWVDCQGDGDGPAGSVGIEMYWGEGTHHLLLHTSDSSRCIDSCDDPGDAKAVGAFVPPAKAADDRRARTGERFGPVFNAFGSARVAGNDRYERLRLEAGTEVAGVLNLMGMAVLRVKSGNVEDLLRRYGKQMGEATLEHHRTPKGNRVATISHEAMGGGVGRLTADPSGKWILLTTSSD